jgi:hypothetical protein
LMLHWADCSREWPVGGTTSGCEPCAEHEDECFPERTMFNLNSMRLSRIGLYTLDNQVFHRILECIQSWWHDIMTMSGKIDTGQTCLDFPDWRLKISGTSMDIDITLSSSFPEIE